MRSYQKEFLNNPEYDVLTEELFGCPFGKIIKDDHKSIVEAVYHCSNERLNSYFKDLNLKDTRVATVGSSGDQALNAIFYGAKDITLIDGNIFTRAYVEYKIAMIKNMEFSTFKELLGKFSMFNWKVYAKISHDISPEVRQFFDELMLNQDDHRHDYDEGFLTDSLIRNNLLHCPCHDFDGEEENIFYNNSKDYEKLQNLLKENNFSLQFITSDIEDFSKKLKGKFDYIFLSNIFPYVDREIMIEAIKQLYKKLNPKGEMQYEYTFHSFNRPENMISKLAYTKLLKSPCFNERDHLVYFIKKPANEKISELIV